MACVRKWRGKWIVDWRDPAGKRNIETVDGNREDAARRLAEVVTTGKQSAGKRLTFEEYSKWWLENCARGEIRESTYQEYEAVLRNHVNPVIGKKSFAKIDRKMIRVLIATKKKEGYDRSTIRNILAPIRGMYNQAIEDGDAFANPAARIGKFNRRTEGEQEKKNPLSREEVQTMLTTVAETMPEYFPVFLCAPRTGLRQGELIAAKGRDLDFVGRFFQVQRNLSRGKIELPKNGKTRKVDMSRQLSAVLDDMLSRRRVRALEAEMKKPKEERRDAATVISDVMDGWLFQTPVGTQLDPSNLRKLFNKLLTAAKLRRVRFHDLRHTFASLLIEQRESLAYIKDQMGHSSIKVTADSYGHLVPGGNRQAVGRLDEAIKPSQEKRAVG